MAGPPRSFWPQGVLHSPHQLMSVSCLPPRASPRAPHLANTVGHSPGAHTNPGSSGLGSRPDTHPMAWPWTQALLCLGVKEHLSPCLPSPSIQHWACQGGLWAGPMNEFIQQYKLSTYCVPGRRQPPRPPPPRPVSRVGGGGADRGTSARERRGEELLNTAGLGEWCTWEAPCGGRNEPGKGK